MEDKNKSVSLGYFIASLTKVTIPENTACSQEQILKSIETEAQASLTI